MDTVEYEYRGLMASSWDLLRGDYSAWPDRPFYRRIIERAGGSPALDVGCGTGRLMLDYMQAGLDVDGVDNSPEMLEIAREKAEVIGLAPRLHRQTMQTLDLPRQYGTIFVPSSSFQLLTDEADAAEAMRRFREHLLPGGVLVMSLMLLWGDRAQPPHLRRSPWIKIGEKQRPEDGTTVRRHIRVMYDHERQLEHEDDRYELLAHGVVTRTEELSRSPSARWYTLEQSRGVFESAGFRDVRLTREFAEIEAQEGDWMWCARGAR